MHIVKVILLIAAFTLLAWLLLYPLPYAYIN